MQQFLLHRNVLRLAAALTAAALATGCAALPGDPYYDGGGYAGPAYYPAAPTVTVYEQPGVIYTAPPPGWRAEAWREHQWREARERERDRERRRDWDRREAERQRALERQRDAQRREADQRRDWERRREAEQRAVPNQRQREISQREQRLLQHPDPDVARARREQFERDHRAERENQRGTQPWQR